MKISPQAILRFQLEFRRQLVTADFKHGRKAFEVFAPRNRHVRTQTRNLHVQRCPVLFQSATAPVPQDDRISLNALPETSTPPGLPPQNPSRGQIRVEQGSLRHLPLSCPGCGGLTQEVEHDEAGFYTRSRRSVKEYIRRVKQAKSSMEGIGTQGSFEDERPGEHEFQQEELISVSTTSGQDDVRTIPMDAMQQDLPFCDRCHGLLHQSRGVSIAHPTIDSIADTIEESPYRQNHVYHVLDAADFPMSLVPSIFNRLELARPRSQNRRSQHDFSPRTTISFIITRSDLLAPQKEMVDTLMPYFISVLREALGRKGQDMRLGNVHLVSAKRGWWTKEIKEAIYKRGGGNWMVGKFNVGKSNLFEVLFPKGYDEQTPVYSQLKKEAAQNYSPPPLDLPEEQPALFSESSLLPPPQTSTPYPTLPLVSPLPGTTASPIRLPFGPTRSKTKGELIDLPGLHRGNLSSHVLPDHQRTLVMEHRPTVTQHVIKPGQSLLLGGGLIRITPLTTPSPSRPNDELILLAYPFTPLPAHVTSNPKAELTQLQQRESGIKSLLAPEAGPAMRSAGTFAIDTDVTKSRSGALLRAGVPLAKLPFRVKGTDILIEGVGWVECVIQVRRKRPRSRPDTPDEGGGENDTNIHHQDQTNRTEDPPPNFHPYAHSYSHSNPPTIEDEFPTPLLEVFTPEGKSVAQRRSMGAWMLIHGPGRPGQIRAKRATMAKGRPRRSMKGEKKRGKMERREME